MNPLPSEKPLLSKDVGLRKGENDALLPSTSTKAATAGFYLHADDVMLVSFRKPDATDFLC